MQCETVECPFVLNTTLHLPPHRLPSPRSVRINRLEPGSPNPIAGHDNWNPPPNLQKGGGNERKTLPQRKDIFQGIIQG